LGTMGGLLPVQAGSLPVTADRCRVCGCTEDDACVNDDDGLPCAWADDGTNLCTACSGAD
jgi:hypothetical protein